MPDYAVRVTHAYESVKAFIGVWALKCDKLLVYEHNEVGKKIHIHVQIMGTSVDKKQLRNIAGATLSPSLFKGNENMSFRTGDMDDPDKNITYMSKGLLEPSYNKGYDPDFLEQQRLKWVLPTQYKKISSWEKLWLEYEPTVDKPKTDVALWIASTELYPPTLVTHEYVKSHAYKWLLKRHNGIWCPQIHQELACLVRTYCYRYNISIPDNHLKKI